MNIYLENLEDFMELVEKNKPKTIFIKKYSELNEQKLLFGHILTQFSVDEDIINYTHKEEIPRVQLPLSDGFLDGASLFIDVDAVKKAGSKIDADVKHFYKCLDDEYGKVKQVFVSKGIKVLEGFVQ